MNDFIEDEVNGDDGKKKKDNKKHSSKKKSSGDKVSIHHSFNSHLLYLWALITFVCLLLLGAYHVLLIPEKTLS